MSANEAVLIFFTLQICHVGFKAYCTDSNSYLFPIDENEKDKIGFYVPSARLLAEQMKKVVSESSPTSDGTTPRAWRVGQRAREDMKNYWSPQRVVSKIVSRLNFLRITKKQGS